MDAREKTDARLCKLCSQEKSKMKNGCGLNTYAHFSCSETMMSQSQKVITLQRKPHITIDN